MNGLPLFSLFAFILMLVLLPIPFGELMAASLGKLHLSPEMALLLMVAIIIGGLVNIPVKRIAHQRLVPMQLQCAAGLLTAGHSELPALAMTLRRLGAADLSVRGSLSIISTGSRA